MKNKGFTTKTLCNEAKLQRHKKDLTVSKLSKTVLEFSLHSFAISTFVPLCLCGEKSPREANI
jgi:hypothetical protein